MTRAWNRAIVGHSLLPVHPIVGLPRGAKRKLLARVVARLRFLEIARELIGARLWKFIKVLYSKGVIRRVNGVDPCKLTLDSDRGAGADAE